MYCSHCGTENMTSAKFCKDCGNKMSDTNITNPSITANLNLVKPESLKIGWIILSVLLPIAGIIIYFNLKQEFPKKAKDAIISAAVGIVINILLMSMD